MSEPIKKTTFIDILVSYLQYRAILYFFIIILHLPITFIWIRSSKTLPKHLHLTFDIRELFLKKICWSQMIQKCLVGKKWQEKIGSTWRVLAVAAVSLTFLHSSLLCIIKALPNLSAVTPFLADFFNWI